VGAAGLGATAVVQTPVPGLIALSIAAMGVFSAIPVFWSLPHMSEGRLEGRSPKAIENA
jgi:hypothetical protein